MIEIATFLDALNLVETETNVSAEIPDEVEVELNRVELRCICMVSGCSKCDRGHIMAHATQFFQITYSYISGLWLHYTFDIQASCS